MSLQLFDSLSREIKPLYPEDGKQFRFYLCGPTVYGPAHIGNFRTIALHDVLYRTLKTAGLNPYYVRNITDVDDKTIKQSQKEGLSLSTFTNKWANVFADDCVTLNMLSPDVEPRAASHIDQQIDLIQKLVEKDAAYQANDGSVYFRVSAWKDYGKLARLKMEDLQTQKTTSSGAVNTADEYDRENISDFALWKARKPEDGDNFWASPWGEGRPGWHIECSAMSMEYLGESFDLHGGGVDLCFPHHENEIAQSEAATGKPFARHWFHCAFLNVDNEKMSKSLKNFHTLEELLAKMPDPMAIRYSLISGHYRQPLNFTFNGLKAAQSALAKLEKVVTSALQIASIETENFETLFQESPSSEWGIFEKAWQKLCDDLNTPSCLGELFKTLNERTNEEISKN
ncbi:MAG: cysteine--tRNA ligase, partial [Opitutaceae bacterium]|nr:cysteine--tRNA ligase [Opitutaceae bacterium]